jgi:hypothetical protein
VLRTIGRDDLRELIESTWSDRAPKADVTAHRRARARWLRFTTAHYGAPDEPGAVITRLSEHRGPDDLAEIAELLEDAWREVAPPDLLHGLGLAAEHVEDGPVHPH